MADPASEECKHGLAAGTCSLCKPKGQVLPGPVATKPLIGTTGRPDPLGRRVEPAPWSLTFPLRPWQEAALSAWEAAGRRGVIEAATGTGKTAVALGAMAYLHEEQSDQLRVAVVVPTKALATQWRRELVRGLGFRGSHIGEIHSDPTIKWADHPVLITVVNSARTKLSGILHRWNSRSTLLVVDECHRVGTEGNARVFDIPADWTLGLSATPERDDGGHHAYVYPGLGKPVYRYPLLQALNDRVLAPVRSISLYVDFSSAERARWQELTTEIGKLLQRLEARFPALANASQGLLLELNRLAEEGDPAAGKVLALLTDRRQLLAEAKSRLACADALLEWTASQPERTLVFHETISSAEASAIRLSELGAAVALEHSQLDADTRRRAMSRFKSGTAQILVCVRSLDEGIDVPEASVAVIVSGSRSRRQRIQRFGRVLRPQQDKEAVVWTILVRGTPEEGGVGGRDQLILGPGRVRHHRWPGVPIVQALDRAESSYEPVVPPRTQTELLALADLGLVEGTDRGQSNRGRQSTNSRPQAPKTRVPEHAGGYRSLAQDFSPNAWYPVDEVRTGAGMPPEAFDRYRPQVRNAYRLSLDPTHTADLSEIHGSEIAAIIRMWLDQRGRR